MTIFVLEHLFEQYDIKWGVFLFAKQSQEAEPLFKPSSGKLICCMIVKA